MMLPSPEDGAVSIPSDRPMRSPPPIGLASSNRFGLGVRTGILNSIIPLQKHSATMVGVEPSSKERSLIAPCGMNCALCLAYQRTKNKCPGCWGEDDRKPVYCRSCIISNCPTIRENSSHFCYECSKVPCRRLKQLDARYRTKYGMSMMENLEELRDRGVDIFLAHQVERYTCPGCHGMLCVHRPQCLTCGWTREVPMAKTKPSRKKP